VRTPVCSPPSLVTGCMTVDASAFRLPVETIVAVSPDAAARWECPWSVGLRSSCLSVLSDVARPSLPVGLPVDPLGRGLGCLSLSVESQRDLGSSPVDPSGFVGVVV
jgi:hypothetical protein